MPVRNRRRVRNCKHTYDTTDTSDPSSDPTSSEEDGSYPNNYFPVQNMQVYELTQNHKILEWFIFIVFGIIWFFLKFWERISVEHEEKDFRCITITSFYSIMLFFAIKNRPNINHHPIWQHKVSIISLHIVFVMLIVQFPTYFVWFHALEWLRGFSAVIGLSLSNVMGSIFKQSRRDVHNWIQGNSYHMVTYCLLFLMCGILIIPVERFTNYLQRKLVKFLYDTYEQEIQREPLQRELR
ncbi:uncharacterized protein LOC119681635 [Teleopsis dalmanni]|uniref:uncharacterized protein LOC119681635 n=1 Tax=Teleopsis dalmanni TaxID=139649 RepID=UPI0018CF898E|nr:uncharacterized protein LOC119681635 [Teleopsis dalmanni]